MIPPHDAAAISFERFTRRPNLHDLIESSPTFRAGAELARHQIARYYPKRHWVRYARHEDGRSGDACVCMSCGRGWWIDEPETCTCINTQLQEWLRSG